MTKEHDYVKNYWRYTGFYGDQEYRVSCDSCKWADHCMEKASYEYVLPANQDSDTCCSRFSPSSSCSFCSQTTCWYRWDYPC